MPNPHDLIDSPAPKHVLVIGAGPAGLMAAEALAEAGMQVDVCDAMPSVGRKFLLAGKGGLNLTHAENAESFLGRYREHAPAVAPWLEAFGPAAIRDWAAGLGVSTFVGSSGKVFPEGMKAAPLLRAWLRRLRAQGVRLHMRHRWTGGLAARLAPPDGPDATDAAQGWTVDFETPKGPVQRHADAVLLALGGGSWARLGSDGAWVPWLRQRGVAVAALQPANCGFDIGWSAHVAERHAGTPLKNVMLRLASETAAEGGTTAPRFERLGEAVITATGIEGNLVYAASGLLREAIAAHGHVDVTLDLLPQRSEADLVTALARGRGSRSWPNHLREQTGLAGAQAALLREGLDAAAWTRLQHDAAALAHRIKALPLRLLAPRPIDEAISTAGGVALPPEAAGVDERLMLSAMPGVYCAGEMLGWDAPTGGYLLTACLASGRWAARSMLARWGLSVPAIAVSS